MKIRRRLDRVNTIESDEGSFSRISLLDRPWDALDWIPDCSEAYPRIRCCSKFFKNRVTNSDTILVGQNWEIKTPGLNSMLSRQMHIATGIRYRNPCMLRAAASFRTDQVPKAPPRVAHVVLGVQHQTSQERQRGRIVPDRSCRSPKRKPDGARQLVCHKALLTSHGHRDWVVSVSRVDWRFP